MDMLLDISTASYWPLSRAGMFPFFCSERSGDLRFADCLNMDSFAPLSHHRWHCCVWSTEEVHLSVWNSAWLRSERDRGDSQYQPLAVHETQRQFRWFPRAQRHASGWQSVVVEERRSERASRAGPACSQPLGAAAAWDISLAEWETKTK